MTKMKLNRLRSSKDVLQKDLRDPEFRAEWERTAPARAIASELIAYRVEQGLSKRRLIPGRILALREARMRVEACAKPGTDVRDEDDRLVARRR